MADDTEKQIVLEAVQNEIGRVLFLDQLSDRLGLGYTIEHHDVGPSETVLRIRSGRRSGAPRYYRVKVSEVL